MASTSFMRSTTDWNISTDIYGIVESIDDLKKRYIEDENETTLALGIFGFLGDTEAKKIQTAVVMSGELGNEMFAQRAKLNKNVVTHAMYCNVDNLNAIPSHMMINLAIKVDDLDLYMKDDVFVFSKFSPIHIGSYEFHLDYDLILKRTMNDVNGEWMYNASYDMSDYNNISDIRNPYLKQPYLINFNNHLYVFMQALVRQIAMEVTVDKMITASVIDNKSFVFNFDNQLADFEVYITEKGITTRLQPIVYGQPVEAGVYNYCWYLYMNENTIRIGFDTGSFMPGLNSEVKIIARTTKGAEGNFTYKSEEDDSGFYVDFQTELYNYKKITCYVNPATPATDGADKKTIPELKNLIPKMAMSRGYITTETDLNNYFNLISTDYNRLKLQKKVDNQLNRIWYCYLVLKDKRGDVIPTNTLPIKIEVDSKYCIDCEEEGRFVVPAGTLFVYDKEVGYCVPVDEVPTPYTDEFWNPPNVYYYRMPYNVVINKNPIYSAYYLTLTNEDGYFEYRYINPRAFMGFVVNTFHFERKLLSEENDYFFTFTMQQSILDDLRLYYEYSIDNRDFLVNNMRVFIVLYKGNEPYRYEECELIEALDDYAYRYKVKFTSDNRFDVENRITLMEMYETGYSTRNYGYFEDNTRAEVFIYAKFEDREPFGRYIGDGIIPPEEMGLTEFSLVNIYSVAGGLNIFNNFTQVMNSRIRPLTTKSKKIVAYDIFGVPMVGEHFFISEDNVTYFIHELLKKKAYIDYCLTVLENNMDVDFKYFNTYGYSETYTMGGKRKAPLGDIDITMKFKTKLTVNTDMNTKNEIIRYIKEYIEDMNDFGDLHIPNLLHDLKEYFGDRVVYIEYMNYNDNVYGINHIELKEVDDIHTVPEFISVRNRWNVDQTELEPCIDLEIVV